MRGRGRERRRVAAAGTCQPTSARVRWLFTTDTENTSATAQGVTVELFPLLQLLQRRKTVSGTWHRCEHCKKLQCKEAMEDTALETLRLIYEARRSQAQPQSWGYPCAGEAGGPVPSASEVPPSLIAASPAPSALTAPMVMAYGALAHSQHSLAVAAALMSAPAVTAPMATYAPVAHSQQVAPLQFTEASPAPPIAYSVPAAPVCAVRPPLMKVWDELPRPRSSAPYKRPAQPTKKPAAPSRSPLCSLFSFLQPGSPRCDHIRKFESSFDKAKKRGVLTATGL